MGMPEPFWIAVFSSATERATHAVIAPRIGYEAYIACSKAFKRWTGHASGAYRQSTRMPVPNLVLGIHLTGGTSQVTIIVGRGSHLVMTIATEVPLGSAAFPFDSHSFGRCEIIIPANLHAQRNFDSSK